MNENVKLKWSRLGFDGLGKPWLEGLELKMVMGPQNPFSLKAKALNILINLTAGLVFSSCNIKSFIFFPLTSISRGNSS